MLRDSLRILQVIFFGIGLWGLIGLFANGDSTVNETILTLELIGYIRAAGVAISSFLVVLIIESVVTKLPIVPINSTKQK